MVIEGLTVLLILIALTAGFTLLARRLTIPDPVLLAIAGIALSFIPVFPTIKLDPEVVLLIILPPLVYSAAVQLTWEDFRSNARPISLFAVGLVLVTCAGVAVVAHALIRSLSWSEAFALGAIVSPTDPVASTALSQRLGLPRRLVAITEGEGLVNDAVALTLLKLATTAIVAHSFSVAAAVTRFGAIAFGEAIYGTAIGWLAAKLRRRITDARVEVAISLLTPFLAYLVPESLGGSGVLATVAAGMYIGIQAPELLSSDTRLSLAGIWDVLTFLLEGALFLLTGLQFRSVINGTPGLHGFHTLLYGAAVIATVVLLRFMWTWSVALGTDHFSTGVNESRLPNRQVTYLAWCGMRGGISLAAALALADQIPSRNLLVFLTACVIAGTLILQGGPLPVLVRALKLDEDARQEGSQAKGLERLARMEAIEAAIEKLEHSGDGAARIRDEYRHRLEMLRRGSSEKADVSPAGYRIEGVRMRLDALAAERRKVIELHHEGRLPEHVLHRIERDLDLREVRLKQLISASD